MELQGPGTYQDTFTKEMLRFNRGGIVGLLPMIYKRGYYENKFSVNTWADHNLHVRA